MTLEIRKGIENALNEAAVKALAENKECRDWTRDVLGALTAEGKRHGFRTCATNYAGGSDFKEWVFDACWLQYDDDEKGAFRKVVLAAESEWVKKPPHKYEDNFPKLVVVRADLRLLVCEAQNKTKAAELIKWLEWYASGFNAAKCDEYMISCWIEDDNKFMHEYFVAR